ncbi:MAG: sulfotransferase domain-containing protein [Caldilinea sp. CFX5]|nr:sulfotransferase domain-containing protein [Caldilinea sp. CFX5]
MNIYTQFLHMGVRLSVAISYLPQRRPDDAIIVAHPRSGSTWLRTMLVNVLKPNAHSNPDVFNKLIPGISIRSPHSMWDLPSPRILTSHTPYLPGFPKVVYVVRDGRDVLVSYYHYLVHRKSKLGRFHKASLEMNFPTFIDRYYQGDYRYIWHQHVESWLTQGKQALGERMLIVRFEEMRANPEIFLDRIATFVGVSANSARIAAAVQQADLGNMRKVERERWQAKGLGSPDGTSSFYRNGQSNSWQTYFTPEITEQFLTRSKTALQAAGYQP